VASYHARDLLADGSLRIRIAGTLLPRLAGWLPLVPDVPPRADAARAEIRVAPGPTTAPLASRPADFRFMTASGWVSADGVATLAGDAGCLGLVDLPAATAELSAPATGADPAAVSADLEALCTISAALLLGRLDRVLAHAAGVVNPGGDAWLLVGDSHAGKSTTCINLIRAGWGYLADDHVVIRREPDGSLRAEGWPRRFNVDVGWKQGESLGRRIQVDPRDAWPGQWRREAPLGGVLFPRVEAESPTRLASIRPADALSRIVRAMPWLLFDRASAPALLDRLRQLAAQPAFELRLGRDVYRDPDRLVEVLDTRAAGA
jgi:hypothetical protein